MEPGSKEHKAQLCEDLIKQYYENIWKDELYLIQLEELQGNKRKEIADIDLKLERKEFNNANEGKKAKFVAEQELKHIENEIKAVAEKVTKLWPARIELVKRYAEQTGEAK
jgi:hypothetical protein